jgi:hypothetical protein
MAFGLVVAVMGDEWLGLGIHPRITRAGGWFPALPGRSSRSSGLARYLALSPRHLSGVSYSLVWADLCGCWSERCAPDPASSRLT